MEIVSSDGSIIQIKLGQIQDLGRANGLNSLDKTISRRQISFFVPPLTQNQETRVQFEILGRNPVCVSKGDEVKIFRKSERGEMENGDMFCVSANNPVWSTLRKIENGGESVRQNDLESELAENLESGYGFSIVEDLQQEGVDISNIDPVKEFGFVVIGHEFDSYPKKIIHDIKNWDWFLDESEKESDYDDDDNTGKKQKLRKRSRKRKKGTENDDDDEWTGESEDEKVLINKSKNHQKPKYVTRSKDRGKQIKKDTSKNKNVMGKKILEVDEEDEDEDDEADETLGGFVVDDENLEEEIEDEEEEEEEEEELVDEDEDE